MLTFGRETLGHLDAALRREWLATNGLGSYAMGTLAGVNTRRYHGLLVAALDPPLGRTMTVAGLDAWAEVGGERVPLCAHEYVGGAIRPDGYRHLESFDLYGGTVPAWTYAWNGVRLEQRIWMPHGRQATYVTFSLALSPGDRPVGLSLTPLCTYRDHHAEGPDPRWDPLVAPIPAGLQLTAFPGATPYRILVSEARWEPGGEWRRGLAHRMETYRGLDDTEDLWAAGTFTATLHVGETLTLVVTTEESVDLDGAAALREEEARAADLLARAALPVDAPDWARQLVLAADQFVVAREVEGAAGQTVIAGYPWFGDWGRDTMIALPGLTLATGRPEVARAILRTFAGFVDQGMLPNHFPDADRTPAYNTVDATLWYFRALDVYVQHTGRGAWDLIRELFPVLADVVAWHRRGTRFGIQVDPADGLLRAGEPGVQLTWMDAKVDDWVVTPRIGKPVEINGLWIEALHTQAAFAEHLGKDEVAADCREQARRAAASFNDRFWYAAGGWLYDVVDGPDGDDPALRPNQVLALALPHCPVPPDQARSALRAVARRLLTSHGLRSLDPAHPTYEGTYGGDRRTRDAAYHQGTVWAWLIGPFVTAWCRITGDTIRRQRDTETARRLLEPFAHHLADAGVGSISEIFDGDAPHAPRGCPAQAWSVAEVLRAWRDLTGLIPPGSPSRHR